MPKRTDIRRVLVIGSGPIIIGQAAEFDYAGTQACRALREEGLQVVLVNSNPATIMTDANIADRVYIEPLTLEFVTKVIEKERPDGLLPTLGGQVGLNMAVQLAESGVLDRFGVKLLGTPLEAIRKGEDRELFKGLMQEIGEPIPVSAIVESVEDAIAFAQVTGYPLIVRPAYTMGGTGGGIAAGDEELRETAAVGLAASMVHQVLIERSVAGWKEIEYEVIRDSADNCITVCSMENIDPVGVHTGDSIVVAPVQTLSDNEHQMLRSASLRIIRALGVEGGCNVQYALHPDSLEYVVIEVNPRVSRSSALASKATGYPIAKVATKVAIGFTLDEIVNAVTGKTYACFEPAIDYAVLKIPRWPFDKFALADRRLGTQMKATGEVMSIDRTFAGALQKAIRSLEIGVYGLRLKNADDISDEALDARIRTANDERLFAIAEAMRRGSTVKEIHDISLIDEWFLDPIREIIDLEAELAEAGRSTEGGSDLADLLRRAKVLGFADREIARLMGMGETRLRTLRKTLGVDPVYKMVDTCAAEFEAATPYYYSTYETENESVPTPRRKILVLGSGPIRIGQGVEFDYCSVHAVWALRDADIESVIINNNPETVSTDFDTSDRLYFEPLVFEDVMNVIEQEQPEGVVVQFGGQTAINLAGPLAQAGVRILGSSVDSIDAAEDRKRFDALLTSLGIPKPAGRTATSVAGAIEIAREVGFPVLVRPSYVLGGRAMEIVYTERELLGYMENAVEVDPERPVLVDKYMLGKEVEVDAICDGTDILIPGIMEHVERAGVHSGDSVAVYPPQTLSEAEVDTLVDHTYRLAKALDVRGLVNIQFVIHEGTVYVIEVNPRSSRTVPFMSKVTGIPMVKLAMEIVLGKSLASLKYGTGLAPNSTIVAVKAPVFSFSKLLKVETSLGPEMKSTGEVMGVDVDQTRALYKALLASGINVPLKGRMAATVADKDKAEAMPLLARLVALGFELDATRGTAVALKAAGVEATTVLKLDEGSPNIVDGLIAGRYRLVINTLTRGKDSERDGFRIRRTAVERGVTCFTSLDTLRAVLDFIPMLQRGDDLGVMALQDYAGQQASGEGRRQEDAC